MNNQQLYEKLKKIKCFNLDDCFEIFFDKQLIVPYFSLEDVQELYPEFGGEAIYMVLQGDRLELKNINMAHDPPIIEYQNCANGQLCQIDNLWFFSHPVRQDALHMKIISGTLLEIGIKDVWRNVDPMLAQYSPQKISIYDLITQSEREKETISALKVLYVGASQNIFERLSNHKTILKIYRHTASRNPEKEIFIWMLKPKQKLLKQTQGLIISNSVWPREGPFGLSVDTEALLFIAEAMLIHYFKPEYNEQHVRTMPNAGHVIYAKLLDAGVNYIQVNLNLFMQANQVILSLKTQTVHTNRAKHISIYAAVRDLINKPKENILSADVLPEELYDLFIGNSIESL